MKVTPDLVFSIAEEIYEKVEPKLQRLGFADLDFYKVEVTSEAYLLYGKSDRREGFIRMVSDGRLTLHIIPHATYPYGLGRLSDTKGYLDCRKIQRGLGIRRLTLEGGEITL